MPSSLLTVLRRREKKDWYSLARDEKELLTRSSAASHAFMRGES